MEYRDTQNLCIFVLTNQGADRFRQRAEVVCKHVVRGWLALKSQTTNN